MTRKPGSMYREIRGQAYAQKRYMGGVPGIKISQFDIGDLRTQFPVHVHLIAEEQCQIRHIALEAARLSANRYIVKKAGNAYHLKLRVYPHNVLRENKIATGAGADRISEGMRAAFGVAERDRAGEAEDAPEIGDTFFSTRASAFQIHGRNGPAPRRDPRPELEDGRPPVSRRASDQGRGARS